MIRTSLIVLSASQLSNRTQSDHGDHRDIMLGGLGAQNIFYSSGSNPIDVNNDTDLEFAKQKVVLPSAFRTLDSSD